MVLLNTLEVMYVCMCMCVFELTPFFTGVNPRKPLAYGMKGRAPTARGVNSP